MTTKNIPSESKWIQAAQQGDQTAFRRLVDLHAMRVRKTVIGMLGDTPEAKDIAQEVFIRLHKSIRKFKGESHLGTYLHRIAINLSLTELKKRKRRKQMIAPANKETADHLAQLKEPDQAAERSELQGVIQLGLEALEPEFRTVVVLRLIQGYSLKETAEMLGIPEGTVASRLARAQQKLRNILSNYL